jgi:hypothetical protein
MLHPPVGVLPAGGWEYQMMRNSHPWYAWHEPCDPGSTHTLYANEHSIARMLLHYCDTHLSETTLFNYIEEHDHHRKKQESRKKFVQDVHAPLAHHPGPATPRSFLG